MILGDELHLVIQPDVRGGALGMRSIDGITTKMGADATARLERLWKFQSVTPMGDGKQGS